MWCGSFATPVDINYEPAKCRPGVSTRTNIKIDRLPGGGPPSGAHCMLTFGAGLPQVRQNVGYPVARHSTLGVNAAWPFLRPPGDPECFSCKTSSRR
jgi:hypothetical protein